MDEQTIALYHFDEDSGDVAKDASGNGHHGKIVGARRVNVGTGDLPADAEPSVHSNSSEVGAMDMSSDLPAIAFDSEQPGDALPNEADVIVDTVTYGMFLDKSITMQVSFDGEPDMPPETHGEPLIFAYGYTGHLGPSRVSSIARYDDDFVPAKLFETDPDTIAIYNLTDTSDNKVHVDSSGNDHHGRILRGRYVLKRRSAR